MSPTRSLCESMLPSTAALLRLSPMAFSPERAPELRLRQRLAYQRGLGKYRYFRHADFGGALGEIAARKRKLAQQKFRRNFPRPTRVAQVAQKQVSGGDFRLRRGLYQRPFAAGFALNANYPERRPRARPEFGYFHAGQRGVRQNLEYLFARFEPVVADEVGELPARAAVAVFGFAVRKKSAHNQHVGDSRCENREPDRGDFKEPEALISLFNERAVCDQVGGGCDERRHAAYYPRECERHHQF